MITDPEDFIPAYTKASATSQWENVAPLIHEDCVVTFSNGSSHQGKDQVEQAFRRNFELIQDDTYGVSDVHWVQRSAHTAIYVYAYAWSGIIHGQPASGAGRGSSTLTYSDDKGWQLICEHLGPAAA